MPSPSSYLSFCVTGLALALSACTPTQDGDPTPSVGGTHRQQAINEPAAASSSDAAVAAAVQATLAKDSELSTLRVSVEAKNGHVILQGDAPDAKTRDRASVVVAGVKGVRSVENRLSLASSG